MLALITVSITLKAWREAKRSPYFFLRRQAAKKMQQYATISLALLLLSGMTTAYAWQAPADSEARVAVLSHAKARVAVKDQPAPEEAVTEESAPQQLEITMAPGTSGEDVEMAAAPTDPLGSPAQLPAEFDQLEPAVELKPNTELAELSFSQDITTDYVAVDPTLRFVSGYFTLYATFAYEGMEDGMVWSWVWRRNGEVVDGGNQRWSYGDEGPGYVYLQPEEGFALGNYSLDVWVNGELMTQGTFVIGDGIAANN
ncbi:MAG: hypothetical protein R3300_04150 [Candidatus Promineifilaceae bacterium]|nr:hypothetical protein [Candidatus Promineifilaceae bacterium]